MVAPVAASSRQPVEAWPAAREVGDLTLVSHKYRFIFVKTRKTAGTSVEIALSTVMGPEDVIGPIPYDEALRVEQGGLGPRNCVIPRSQWRVRDYAKGALGRPPRFSQHSPATFIKRSLPPEVWDSYTKFTIDRNCWDLAVSAYNWYEKRHQAGIEFAEFLYSEALDQYSNWQLYTIENRLVVDEMIRYERLSEEFAALSQRLDLPGPLELPVAKGGLRGRKPYQDWYDEKSKARVASVFAREIDHFGWTFD